jgi:prophage antirepressor-like protein
LPTTEESLGQLVELAQEQLRWVRASVLPDVRKTIEETLTTTQLRKAYEMCDGENTGQTIANAVDASQPTLSRWTRSWRDVGITYETPKGRIQHLVSLSTLGIPLEVEAA